MKRRPLRSTLFPYTTLFRSRPWWHHHHARHRAEDRGQHRAPEARSADRDVDRPAQEIGPGLSHTPLHATSGRSEEHTSELQSQSNLVCRLLLEKKKKGTKSP